MRLILASNNKNKLREFKQLVEGMDIELLSQSEAGLHLDVEETGTTFEENALLKAESGCRESGMPCIADDSGLAVDKLGGAPGVYSARYSGVHGDDDANNKKLLRELYGVPPEERGAAYVSVVCCVYPDGRVLTARGECRGKIGFTEQGDGGFGYDPLFLPEEYGSKRTMAQLTADEKDAISHRGKAVQEIARRIGEIKE